MSKWSKIRKDIMSPKSLLKGKSWSAFSPLNVATGGTLFALTRGKRDFGKVLNCWHNVRHPSVGGSNSAVVARSVGNTGFRRYT